MHYVICVDNERLVILIEDVGISSSTRGLNRDQAVQINSLSSGNSFVGKRKFIFNAFVDLSFCGCVFLADITVSEIP